MGKEKYLRIVEELFRKSAVVSYSSIERIIVNKKGSREYTKQLIRYLVLQGKIFKIAKGFYSRLNEISLSVFCFAPSYFGLQDALSYHNIWEQETIPIIVTARKVRQGIRNVLGGNVMVRIISKKYMFGFDSVPDGNLFVPYSDIEKTFIDMVYFREKMSLDVINNFKSKIDSKKLNSYLKQYPINFRDKVLNTLK